MLFRRHRQRLRDDVAAVIQLFWDKNNQIQVEAL